MAKKHSDKRVDRKPDTTQKTIRRTADPISAPSKVRTSNRLAPAVERSRPLEGGQDAARQRQDRQARMVTLAHEIAVHTTATASLSEKHKQAHMAAVALVTPQSPIRPAVTLGEGVKPSSWASIGATPQKKVSETKHIKEAKPERSESLREAPNCKERPEPKAGMGNSRHYVPWCDVNKKKH